MKYSIINFIATKSKRKLFDQLFLLIIFYSISNLINAQDINTNKYQKYFYPSGQISSEGLIKNGKPDGYWKTYYASNILKSEGNRKNYLLDSIWIFYTETGDTSEIVNYLNGKKTGYYIKFAYENTLNIGKKKYIASKELYINDLKQGISYTFYNNGKIHEEAYFTDSKLNGISKEYDNNGLLITTKEYRKGTLINYEKINRFDIKGNKIGVWRDFYKNGKIKKEENFNEGKLNGIYKEFDEGGKLNISLFYRNDSIDNKQVNNEDSVEIRNIYNDKNILIKSGAFKKGVPVGIHREYNENGVVINSYIYNQNGNISAQGIITEKGIKQGIWKFFYNNGNIKVEGQYLNNKKTGLWIYYYISSKIQEKGNFNSDLLSGLWTWYNEDGKIIRIENFIDGKENGLLTEFNNKDTIIHGNYSDGLKNGLWYERNGEIIEIGIYINGLKDGIWKSYYITKELYFKGSFFQGNANGKHYFYYKNGKVDEERYYDNGRKIDNWSKYDELGKLLFVILYKNDEEYKINGIKISKIGKK